MSTPDVKMWLAEPLPGSVNPILQRLLKTDGVRHIRIMPDVHLAHEVCVGMVVATAGTILPGAVGSDIGCGMAALAFDCDAGLLASEASAARLLAGLYRRVPANRQPEPRDLPRPLARNTTSDPRLETMKRREARIQFGTLGRGNHFVEFQRDESDRMWLMLHSGSRAIGQAIYDLHLARSTRTLGNIGVLDAASEPGRAYLNDMAWAVQYAAANRRAMAEAVAQLVAALFEIAADWPTYADCSHNYVCGEPHFGTELWVHRKGAISARENEPGIIPGSMGTASFHVEGRGEPESLCSSSHGAGRRMSRSDARRRITTRQLSRQLDGLWYDHRIAAALREEAPRAYRDVDAVLRAQRDLTRIVRRLVPVLCYKGT